MKSDRNLKTKVYDLIKQQTPIQSIKGPQNKIVLLGVEKLPNSNIHNDTPDLINFAHM